MATAAERALGEARIAISTLTTPLDEPLDVTLRKAAEAVAPRMGAEVEVRCTGTPHLGTEARQSLERIVREATSNAVRHGQARKCSGSRSRPTSALRVSGRRRRARLRQCPRAAGRDSFGMVSMRERAQAMDAKLTVRRRPARGRPSR